MTVGPLLARLRRATGPLHEQLEGNLRVVDRLASEVKRPSVVAAYARLHRSADTALRPWLKDAAGLDYRGRRPVPSEQQAGFPRPTSQAEALGAFYVLEGASLGGRVIRRELEARGVSITGLEFLDPYGECAGQRWRDFVAVLENLGATDPAGVERGAMAAFEFTGRCLAEEVPA